MRKAVKPFEPKPKECQQCGSLFRPFSSTSRVCSPVCARKLVNATKAKDKVALKARLAALKRIPDLIKEAQREFNSYVRERDRLAGHACISSNRPLDWTGNAVDAGHYRSTGAASHLRFAEDNCHAQSKHDNQFLAGNAVDYRLNLIDRIGFVRVDALENNNTVHKWTREELIEIKDKYRAKTKALKQERE